MKSNKKWHDYKAFYWGGANCSYLAMFKALLLPNYISEQNHNFSGMLVTLPNIEKITLSTL